MEYEIHGMKVELPEGECGIYRSFGSMTELYEVISPTEMVDRLNALTKKRSNLRNHCIGRNGKKSDGMG